MNWEKNESMSAGSNSDSAKNVLSNTQAGTGASRTKSTRGFASMDPSKQKEIARKGGKAAHEKGTAHEFTSDEARAAGRKGGEAVSRDRKHMAEIGREGGQARGQRVARRKEETSRQNPSVDSAIANENNNASPQTKVS